MKSYPNVLYTDVDTVWLADPRPFLAGEYDVWTSLDEEHGNYRVYCTGFMAFLPTQQSVSVLKMWDAELSKKPDLNQFVWNRLLGRSKVKVGALPMQLFPPGIMYFGVSTLASLAYLRSSESNASVVHVVPWTDRVVVVHNNWITGKKAKVQRFKDSGLWKVNSSSSQMLVVEPKCPSGACPADLGVGSNARRGDETAHGEFPSGRTTDGNEGEKLWQGGACSAWRHVREVHLFHYRDPDWMKYYGVIENFGDYLGLVMMERLVGPVVSLSSGCPKPPQSSCAHARQLHTIGSIVHCASSDDIIWGSGQRSADILHVLGRESQYAQLECFAVRGPRTRTGLQAKGCACPEVYGDPGLLFPFLFPEFQRSSQPTRAFLIVMHFTEQLIPGFEDHIIFNSEPWHDVIRCQSS